MDPGFLEVMKIVAGLVALAIICLTTLRVVQRMMVARQATLTALYSNPSYENAARLEPKDTVLRLFALCIALSIVGYTVREVAKTIYNAPAKPDAALSWPGGVSPSEADPTLKDTWLLKLTECTERLATCEQTVTEQREKLLDPQE